MAGVAKLAQELGHDVSGSDKNIFPPMDKQLDELGINIIDSTKEKEPPGNTDLVIIGNGMVRGTPIIEYILENHLNYCSGPEWISNNILQNKKIWDGRVSGVEIPHPRSLDIDTLDDLNYAKYIMKYGK